MLDNIIHGTPVIPAQTQNASASASGFGTHDVCVVRLNGLLLASDGGIRGSSSGGGGSTSGSRSGSTEDRLALMEVARQLCQHHKVNFSKNASQADNLVFLQQVKLCVNQEKTSGIIIISIYRYVSMSMSISMMIIIRIVSG